MTTEEISVQEAAARLGRHYITVQQMCRSGRLVARKIGGRGPWRIRISSVVGLDVAPSTTKPAPSAPDTPEK